MWLFYVLTHSLLEILPKNAFWSYSRVVFWSQSGREKRCDESFQAQAEKPLGTNSHQTKRSSKCWLLIGHKKCFVLLCPIDEQFLLSSFRESYTTAIVSITACLVHAPKKCTQSGNFQFDINSPFQNTVYPKTTDAFPKIQAWAYNRYPHLHRSCLRKYYGVKDAMTADTQTKSEFAFFQSLSWLFQLAYFVKCKQTLLELNFYQPYPSS